MATREAREQMALEVAAGMPYSTIAAAHGYSSSAPVRRMLDEDPDFQQLVEEAKERVANSTKLLLMKALMHSNDLLDTMLATAKDPDHPKGHDARKYLLDKIWPATHQSEQNINLTIDAEVTGQLLAGVKQLVEVRGASRESLPIEEDKHLLPGQTAVEQIRSQLAVDVTHGNGRGGS